MDVDGGRQLNLEICRIVELGDPSGLEREVEHMSAARAGLGREMEMPSIHLDAIERVGKPEANHRPEHVLEIGDALLGERRDQWWVGAALFRDRADAHPLEA